MLYVRSCPPLSSGRSLPGLTQSIFTIRLPLPADSFVGWTAVRAAHFVQINEIDDCLAGLQQAAELVAVYPSCHHDHFGFSYDFRQVVAQHLAEMRNLFLNILTIRSDKSAHRYVFVPDKELAALAQEAFC